MTFILPQISPRYLAHNISWWIESPAAAGANFGTFWTEQPDGINLVTIIPRSRNILSISAGVEVWISGSTGGAGYGYDASGVLELAGVLATELTAYRALTGSFSFTGSTSTTVVLLQSLAGSFSFAGTVAKFCQKALTGVLATTGAVVKASSWAMVGSLALAGQVGRAAIILQGLTGALPGPTGSLDTFKETPAEGGRKRPGKHGILRIWRNK